MKAFLLAAGHGTRLRPLTDDRPKCLIPVRGVPMLEIWLDTCARFGIDEVLINIHAHAGLVRDFVRHYCGPVRVDVVEELELLGSAGTLRANSEWIGSDNLFWVFYADVLHTIDLDAMLKLQTAKDPVATIGVYRVPDPTRCGIVEVQDDGAVVSFIEKPAIAKSNLAFAGIFVATPDLLQHIPDKTPADIGFDVLPRLVGRMMAYPVNEYLIDIGTLENYERAQVTWPGYQESA